MSELDRAARKLEPGTLVKMFILDLTFEGGPILRFHPYTNLAPNTLVFQGETYIPYPIKDDGWEINTKGTLPQPTITVSNIGGFATNLLRFYNDFVGCEFTRKRTYAQFLDDGAEANPAAEFPPEIFTINRRKTETNTLIEFELTSKWDAEGIQIPRRQIIAGFCQWLYRGADCSYAGIPVATDEDVALSAIADHGLYDAGATYAAGDYVYILLGGIRQYYVSKVSGNTHLLTDETYWGKDVCAKKINSCRLRFGTVSVGTREVIGWLVQNGGTGYSNGDILTAVGGTFTAAFQIEIVTAGTGGSIAGGDGAVKTGVNAGTYSVIPANPVHLSGGTGTGATINLNWSAAVGSGGVLPTGAFPGAAKVII